MLNSIIAMIICIILSGYFSATETAFSTLNKTRLRVKADSGNPRAALALKLSYEYDKLISTILIGNNIVNIATASIGTVLFIKLLGDEELGTTVSTVVVTLLVLVFGEITPKSIARDYPESFAMFSSPALRLIILLLTPLNFIFSKWKHMVGKLFKPVQDTKFSQEELLLILDEVHQEGGLDDEESTLLKNAVEFGQMEAQDILTPRTDLIGVSVFAQKQELVKIFDSCGYSRIPVYEQSMDKIVGIIHRADFYVSGGITEKSLREIMTDPLFVLRSEKLDDLLYKLRTTKAHLAVVADEFGGTLGILTMEDILEELVGEIWDEHDVAEEDVKPVAEGEFIVKGSMSLDDFCTEFSLKNESESISVGGWVMEMLGHIPKSGDSFIYKKLAIKVLSTENHRVKQISLKQL